MYCFWNQKDLHSPPVNRCKVDLSKQDLKRLKNMLMVMMNELKEQNILHKEAAVLSRLIYRMKFKFRHDKGLKNMEKVNHCLLQYLNMTFYNELKIFIDTFGKDEENSNESIYLPTQQMLEFILVKLQALAALFCHTIDLSCIAGFYLKERINLGQSWAVSILAFSLMSRILVISKHFTNQVFHWYDVLYSYHSKFKPKGMAWLPENYNFPISLESLLNTDWFNRNIRDENLIPTLDYGVNKIFKLIEESEVMIQVDDDNLFEQMESNNYESNSTTNKNNCPNVNSCTSNQFPVTEHLKDVSINDEKIEHVRNNYMSLEDIGVKYVALESLCDTNTFKKLNGKGALKIKNKSLKKDSIQNKVSTHSYYNINDIHTLENFMKKEDKYRKIKSVKSLSCNLKESEWKMLQKVVVKYMKKILTNKSTKKSKKVISNIKHIIDKTLNNKAI